MKRMKKSTYTRRTKDTAIATLRKFFSAQSGTNEVTPDEVYAIYKRTDLDPALNRNWLSNKMTALYYYSLIEPVYSYNDGVRRLKSMRLTAEGVKSLNRTTSSPAPKEESAPHTSIPKSTTMADVAKVVKDFRDSNPEYEVVFDIKLREVQPTK